MIHVYNGMTMTHMKLHVPFLRKKLGPAHVSIKIITVV